jgi:hypothetical protein
MVSPVRQQAMQPCHANVVDSLYAVPHQLGGKRSLFRDGNIRCSRGKHCNPRVVWRPPAPWS